MATVLPPILLTLASVPLARPAQPSPSSSAWAVQRRRGALAADRPLGPEVRGGAGSAVPFCLAAILVSVALVLAPEQPHHQEAICQRHSGEVACRVW
jgi:hypothetical protein